MPSRSTRAGAARRAAWRECARRAPTSVRRKHAGFRVRRQAREPAPRAAAGHRSARADNGRAVPVNLDQGRARCSSTRKWQPRWRRRPGHARGKADILGRGLGGEQRAGLEHETYVLAAGACVTSVPPRQMRPPSGVAKPGDHAQERGLAAAGSPSSASERALVDGKIDRVLPPASRQNGNACSPPSTRRCGPPLRADRASAAFGRVQHQLVMNFSDHSLRKASMSTGRRMVQVATSSRLTRP